MTAIKGDYRTHKHIPSRSCYQLIIEVSEEEFPKVCDTLGYPRTGENTYVGIALLDKQIYHKPPVAGKSDIQQTEGEKLRTRAGILCGDRQFQEFASGNIAREFGTITTDMRQQALDIIYGFCEIESRTELVDNIDAQHNFKMLLKKFDAWKVSQQYADNLSR